MKVRKDTNGSWFVADGSGYILASGMTNSEAWRFVDKANREPVNKQEDISDWAFRQKANK